MYLFLAVLGFPCLHGLSLVVASKCTAQASHCGGFSYRGAQAQGSWLGSCGARASLLSAKWDLPGAGIQPVSPALAGRLLSTVLPGKSPGLGFPYSNSVRELLR